MKIALMLTPAQLRCVNASLARDEAEDHDDNPEYRQDVMDRTRAAVWEALDRAGVKL
jgi:hypothetical protein